MNIIGSNRGTSGHGDSVVRRSLTTLIFLQNSHYPNDLCALASVGWQLLPFILTYDLAMRFEMNGPLLCLLIFRRTASSTCKCNHRFFSPKP
jgi:hypothetical protein